MESDHVCCDARTLAGGTMNHTLVIRRQRQIGSGTYAAVFAVEGAKDSRLCAKWFNSDNQSKSFLEELAMSRALLKAGADKHEGLLIACGYSLGLPILFMPLAVGSICDETMLRGRRELSLSPVVAATQVWTQISSALKFMHSKTLVHCDLQPGNVLVRAMDSRHIRVSLADFGLTRAAESAVCENVANMQRCIASNRCFLVPGIAMYQRCSGIRFLSKALRPIICSLANHGNLCAPKDAAMRIHLHAYYKDAGIDCAPPPPMSYRVFKKRTFGTFSGAQRDGSVEFVLPLKDFQSAFERFVQLVTVWGGPTSLVGNKAEDFCGLTNVVYDILNDRPGKRVYDLHKNAPVLRAFVFNDERDLARAVACSEWHRAGWKLTLARLNATLCRSERKAVSKLAHRLARFNDDICPI